VFVSSICHLILYLLMANFNTFLGSFKFWNYHKTVIANTF